MRKTQAVTALITDVSVFCLCVVDIDKHEALHMTGMPDSEAAKFEGAAKTGMQDLPIGSTRPDGGEPWQQLLCYHCP